MTKALADDFGNASSVHAFGQKAKAHLDLARARVARLIGAEPNDLVWTAGGTEADNFAVRGIAEALEARGRTHLVASAIEHEAVLNTCKHLARRGWTLTLLPPDAEGLVSPDALREVVTAQTALVSVMHANNEIGTVQPIAELARVAHDAGAVFHTDAVQTVGKLTVQVEQTGARPALVVGPQVRRPQGNRRAVDQARHAHRADSHWRPPRAEPPRGHRERASVGRPGRGCGRGPGHLEASQHGVGALRDRLEAGILTRVTGTLVNGDRARRVHNTTNISFDRVEAESLLIALDLEGIAVSTGSACSSGTLEPSHVLKAMRLPPARTQGALRFSLGPTNTEEEVDHVLRVLPGLVEKLRSLTRMPVSR